MKERKEGGEGGMKERRSEGKKRRSEGGMKERRSEGMKRRR